MGVDARPVVATHIYNLLPANNPHCKYKRFMEAPRVCFTSVY